MKKEVIVQKNPKSAISETFRTLRTNIQFMNSKRNLKSILVTSTEPGEGKSWVTANLAVTFAKAGKKVVLVDADMRKGRQHIIFGTENYTGLSNFLSGIDEAEDTNISKYIQRTEIPNLFLITKGEIPPNPSELLTSDSTIRMISELEQIFDLIIFDGTPGIIVTDAIVLSRLVDTSIIVTQYNKTKKENLVKVKKSIENVGGKIAGVIINRIPKQGKNYENEYYYNLDDIPTMNKHVKSDICKEFLQQDNIDRENNNESKMRKQEILEEINEYIKKDKK